MTITDQKKQDTIVPADSVPGPTQGHWTYNEYAKLPDTGDRYEVMDGVLLMSPSPNSAHQNVVTMFGFYLTQYVKLAGLGKVFVAPLDVELARNRVVQPDVVVVLNENLAKITKSHIVGAPDLVVEVASPGTATYDRLSKLKAYEQAEVAEYWLVNPDRRSIELLVLSSGKYESIGIFQHQNILPSRLVPNIANIPVEHFFD